MTKLNDTQTILLSTASRRENGSLYPLPDTVAAGGVRVTKATAALLARGLAEERESDDPATIHRAVGEVGYGLFITDAGLRAIGVVPEAGEDEGVGAAAAAAEAEPTAPAPRQTKAALVLGLLQRDEGATLTELMAATDWLPHTTRAALTGLRKKGHDIARTKRDGATCYRVASGA